MSIITLNSVKKSFGVQHSTTEILHNINLVIQKGEFIAITGPSGSGKSTLMNILGLLDNYDEGTYAIEDIMVSNLSDTAISELRLHKIGFVFQSFNLISNLNVQDNIQIPLIYSHVKRAQRLSQMNTLLDLLGIADKKKFMPYQLSGGQQQRVAIARSLINNPSIILADEPTGNLDTKNGADIMNIFKYLNNMGVTIVLVTHDLKLAQLCKRIITVQDGNIISDSMEPNINPGNPQILGTSL